MKETQGDDGAHGHRRERMPDAAADYPDAAFERFLSETNAADAGLLLVGERPSAS